MDYDSLAAFARTFGLLYMLLLFAAVLGYALWPRNRRKFADAAQIPLKED